MLLFFRLHLILKDQNILLYLNKNLNFLAASRSNGFNEQQNISSEDPLIKDITNKIDSITDYESFVKSGGNTNPVVFANESNIKGQIFTIELYSNVYALLVELGKGKLEDSENRIISEFCKGIALIFANNKESNNDKANQTPEKNIKEVDHQLADNLYDSMLPSSLPSIPGWELAKYFYPSAKRADFMDIFNLTTDKYMILLGKCSGSGINAAMYVPASILSGIVVYSIGFKSSCLTPFITISEVPAPTTSAPIAFKKFAKSIISGSCAAFCILVAPSARTEASIIFSVAPTEGISR